jgi:hypothetical protein
MLDSFTSMSLLTVMEIVGPLVLAGGLAYGIWVASRRRRVARVKRATKPPEGYSNRETNNRTTDS